jgi:hypothetical protein
MGQVTKTMLPEPGRSRTGSKEQISVNSVCKRDKKIVNQLPAEALGTVNHMFLERGL